MPLPTAVGVRQSLTLGVVPLTKSRESVPAGTSTAAGRSDRGNLLLMDQDRCWCTELPEVMPDTFVQDDVRLASVLEDKRPVDPSRPAGPASDWLYQCLVCGQWWRDGVDGDGAFRKVRAPMA